MKLVNFNTYFFFFVLIAVTVGAFLLFEPFLSAIFVAMLLAGMFHRMHVRLTDFLKGHDAWSAFLVCIVVVFLIVLPVFGLVRMVSGEVVSIVSGLTTEGSPIQQSIFSISQTLVDSRVGIMFADMTGIDLNQDIGGIAQSIGERLSAFVQTADRSSGAQAAQTIVAKTYSSITGGLIWIFVMFFTLFYFLIDGKRFLSKMMQLSPLRDHHEKVLFERFSSMARATLRGTLIIGTIQGVIGGVALVIADVASPGLWTVVMIFLAIIPAVGAGLVLFPIAITMFFLGSLWQAVFLLGVGVVVSSIDNILRPKLVGEDTQMHSLLVFFGTIGGMSMFGLIGFVIGPIILALALALWEIYELEFGDQLSEYNR